MKFFSIALTLSLIISLSGNPMVSDNASTSDRSVSEFKKESTKAENDKNKDAGKEDSGYDISTGEEVKTTTGDSNITKDMENFSPLPEGDKEVQYESDGGNTRAVLPSYDHYTRDDIIEMLGEPIQILEERSDIELFIEGEEKLRIFQEFRKKNINETQMKAFSFLVTDLLIASSFADVIVIYVYDNGRPDVIFYKGKVKYITPLTDYVNFMGEEERKSPSFRNSSDNGKKKSDSKFTVDAFNDVEPFLEVIDDQFRAECPSYTDYQKDDVIRILGEPEEIITVYDDMVKYMEETEYPRLDEMEDDKELSEIEKKVFKIMSMEFMHTAEGVAHEEGYAKVFVYGEDMPTVGLINGKVYYLTPIKKYVEYRGQK